MSLFDKLIFRSVPSSSSISQIRVEWRHWCDKWV